MRVKTFILICLAASLPIGLCSATTFIWNATNTGDWFDAANWTPTGVPGSNDTVYFSSGSVDLTSPVIINGQLNWAGGSIGGSPFTITSNGVLNIQGPINLDGPLINYGTVNWQTGEIDVASGGDSTGDIWNETGGVWNIECDQPMDGEDGDEVFYNAGQVIKEAGANQTTMDLAVNNTGQMVTQSGTITIHLGSILGGTFQAAARTAISIGSPYGPQPVWINGPVNFEGPGIVQLTDSSLAGSFSGTLNWIGCQISPGSSLTVLSNGVLNIQGQTSINGPLTNYGTINWQTGEIDVVNGGGATGDIWNETGGVWKIECDQAMYGDYEDEVFYNAGQVIKEAGPDLTIMGLAVNNTGQIVTQSGTIGIYGGSILGGTFQAATGTAISIGSPYVPQTFWINGPVNFEGPGIVLVTNSSLAGSLSSTLNWAGGQISPGSPLTVLSNGVLNIQGQTSINGPLTNYGTVNWQTGEIDVVNGGGATGAIWNETGGVWNIECDQPMYGEDGDEVFYNAGQVIKEAGPNLTIMGVAVNNTGQMVTQSGTISIHLGSILGGTFQAAAGTAISIGSPYVPQPVWINGPVNFEGPGIVQLINSSLAGSFSGTLNWAGCQISPGSSLTVLSNGVLNIQGQISINGPLTNYGTINWQTGEIDVVNGGGSTGDIWNETGGVWNIECDQPMYAEDGDEVFYNAGQVIKEAGPNLTIMGLAVNNSGKLAVDVGTIQLMNGATLTNGTLCLGINSSTSFGQIAIPGAATLGGALNVHFNNGYTPGSGKSFALVQYGSESGVFAPVNLLSGIAWKTNYTPTQFILTALGLNAALVPSLITNGTPNQPPQFMLQFSGSTNLTYTVLATTNLALPLSNWVNLGTVPPLSNGVDRFLDPQSTNFPARFYMLRAP